MREIGRRCTMQPKDRRWAIIADRKLYLQIDAGTRERCAFESSRATTCASTAIVAGIVVADLAHHSPTSAAGDGISPQRCVSPSELCKRYALNDQGLCLRAASPVQAAVPSYCRALRIAVCKILISNHCSGLGRAMPVRCGLVRGRPG